MNEVTCNINIFELEFLMGVNSGMFANPDIEESEQNACWERFLYFEGIYKQSVTKEQYNDCMKQISDGLYVLLNMNVATKQKIESFFLDFLNNEL